VPERLSSQWWLVRERDLGCYCCTVLLLLLLLHGAASAEAAARCWLQVPILVAFEV